MSTLELTLVNKDELLWQDEGICAQTDPDAFYPELGQEGTAAKKICRTCPVRDLCLQYAYEVNDDWAVMGGLTAKERKVFRKQRLRPTIENIDEWIDASLDSAKQRRMRIGDILR